MSEAPGEVTLTATRQLKAVSARGFSWLIAGLLLLALFINYLDRQTLSVLAPFLPSSLRMSNIAYGHIQSLFLLAYALAMPLAGWMLDRLGTRSGLALAVALWSIVETLHGTARSVAALGACRFLLGVAEAAGLPAVSKVAAEHAAPHARATMIGVGMFGVGLGSTLAPPLVAYITVHSSWNWAFYATGLAGIVWVVLWLSTYRPGPQLSPRARVSWLALVRDRRTVGLILARTFADATWWVYLFWIPPLLAQTRAIDLHRMGVVGWIPYFFASVGSVVGGYASGLLIRGGWSPPRARSATMWVAAGVVLITAVTTGFALNAADVGATLTLLAIAVFFMQVFFANIFSLPADLFPAEHVGSVFGLCAMTGTLGGFFSVQAVGYVAERFSYAPVFFGVAFLLPLSALCILAFVRPSQSHAVAERPLCG